MSIHTMYIKIDDLSTQQSIHLYRPHCIHFTCSIPLSSGFAAELTAKPTLQDVFFDCGELGEFEDGK